MWERRLQGQWMSDRRSRVANDLAFRKISRRLPLRRQGEFQQHRHPFQNVRAVGEGHDADLAKLQNIPVKFECETENSNGKFFFVIVDQEIRFTQAGPEIRSGVWLSWKVQQTYSRPSGRQRRQPGDFYFPAPIRWSLNPNPSAGQPTGAWEIGNFQPENWVWFDNSELAIPRKPDELPVARFAEAKCMGCHTTGFDFVPPTRRPPTSTGRCRAPAKWRSAANAVTGRGVSTSN